MSAGVRFELFEKVLVIFGVLYLIEKLNIQARRPEDLLTFLFLIGALIFYSFFAHLKLPYPID